MRPTRYFQSEMLAPEGAALFSWSPSGELLAAAAQRRKKVVLFDKTGAVVASLTVPDPEFLYDETQEAPVLALAWHPAGTHLAILPRGQPFAMVWAVSGDLARVEGGVKPAEVTAMAWSPSSLALALGTVRGTGVVCSLATRTTTPLQLGRSVKAIVCMAWSSAAVPGGLLALGCKGGALLLVRAADGCVARALQLPKATAAAQLQFCEAGAAGEAAFPPAAAAQAGGSLLAASLGGRSVGVWQLPQALSAEHGGASGGLTELSFRDGFGQLSQYCWLSRSLLLAGFSSGQLVAAVVALGGAGGANGGLQYGGGTGTEVYSSRLLDHPVASLSWCPAAGLLAAAGGGQLAVLRCWPGGGGEPPSLRQEAALLELERNQRVAAVQASPDGRLLTLCTASGRLLQLLASPPLLSGAWGPRLAYVDAAAASAEARVLDAASLLPGARGGRLEAAVQLPCEAELLALGPTHLAAAQANKVWLVAVDPEPSTGLLPPPLELDFPAPIRWMSLGAACLLLLGEGGRVFVRLGPAAAAGGEVVELRGDDGEPFSAGCAALTERCIYVGLPSGTLACYRCSDAALLSEFRHDGGALTALHPSPDGSMLLFQDGGGGTFLYHAAHGHLMPLPEYAGGAMAAAAWDGADPELLLVVGKAGTAQVYRHIPASVRGPGVKLVGSQAAAKGAAPLSLLRGVATWHLPGGGLDTQRLDTHRGLEEEAGGLDNGGSGSSPELLAARCQQAIALCHWPAALAAAAALGDPEQLRELALAALQLLQPGVAAAAYEAAGDEAAAAALRPLQEEQDEGLVMGTALAWTGDDPDRAEELLLGSCRPAAAIEAAARAGRWERAMELAAALEPHAVGGLALLRAQALEAEGQAEAALAAYQEARDSPDLVTGGAAAARRRLAECAAGAARCAILSGDVERGAELAVAAGDAALLLQCAELLEQGQHPREAGKLYAAAGQHERAARLLLSCREFGLLDAEMVHAGSPELWHKYAQAKEDLGSYREAARAYERAGDVAAAVRVLLDRLDDAGAAAALADAHGVAEPRLAVARHCERAGRLEEAMRLYCLAGACPAAFLVAQRNACVPAFAELARAHGWAEAADLAAMHFELAGQLAQAGEMAALAGQTERAARLLLQAGGDSIAAAVKLAGEAKEGAAAALVLEHLQGAEGGGAALLDLHLALGSWDQACQVAVACAERERAAGNYKSARDQLLRACLELQARGAPASPALLATLHTLHAYSLVRQLVRRGDHGAAARLLLLVAERIAEFPRHAAPILTSTVIECHRAALHGQAQRWAAALLEQHPGQVSAAYAKKVETIARQPAWAAEQGEPEPRGDCLFCGASGPETSLTCAACARSLPFCAASGKRMLLADWSECPGCHFPCRGQELARAAALDRCCPLCESPLEVHDVRRIFDPFAHCRRTVFAGLLGAGGQQGA